LLVKLRAFANHIFIDSLNLGAKHHLRAYNPKVGHKRSNYYDPASEDEEACHNDPEADYPSYQVDYKEDSK